MIVLSTTLLLSALALFLAAAWGAAPRGWSPGWLGLAVLVVHLMLPPAALPPTTAPQPREGGRP